MTAAIQATEAEQAVLACMFLKRCIHQSTLDTITPGDFGNAAHRKIYDAALALQLRGEPIDFITVMAELGPDLDEIGGPAILTALTGLPVSVANVESYNRLILEGAGRRKLLSVAAMIQSGVKVGQDIDSITESIMAALEGARSKTAENTRRFTFDSFDEIMAEQEPAEWLIKNYLEQGKLAEIYGPSDTYKSFIAISMMLSAATGLSWFGNEVKVSGPTLYICGEGRLGIRKRLKAWAIDAGFIKAPVYVSRTSAAITDPDSLREIDAAISKIPSGPPVFVVIDTLARNFGAGDENSTADMGRFVAGLDHIKDRHGCAVLVVHHTGLAATDRDRGSSVLKGSVDFQYSVKRGTDTVTMTCAKIKDHEKPEPITFKPRVIETGDYDDEKPITSLVLDKVGGEVTERQQTKISHKQRIALDALTKVSADSGKAYVEDWRDESYRSGIGDSQNSKRQNFLRARRELLENGIIDTRDDFYWVSDHSVTSVTSRDNVTA